MPRARPATRSTHAEERVAGSESPKTLPEIDFEDSDTSKDIIEKIINELISSPDKSEQLISSLKESIDYFTIPYQKTSGELSEHINKYVMDCLALVYKNDENFSNLKGSLSSTSDASLNEEKIKIITHFIKIINNYLIQYTLVIIDYVVLDTSIQNTLDKITTYDNTYTTKYSSHEYELRDKYSKEIDDIMKISVLVNSVNSSFYHGDVMIRSPKHRNWKALYDKIIEIHTKNNFPQDLYRFLELKC